MLKEIKGWPNARIEWHEQLREVQRQLPVEKHIQLTGINVSMENTLIDNKKPARAFSMVIKGHATGKRPNPPSTVKEFERGLPRSPLFKEMIEEVEVLAFKEDTAPGARRSDRQFEFNCIYKPKMFK